MSDRIEKLAKQYGAIRRKEMPPEHPFKYEDGIELAEAFDAELSRAVRFGVALGAAEACTQRSPQIEGEA